MPTDQSIINEKRRELQSHAHKLQTMSGRLWGEIDTKPIESVQTALNMFEDKSDQIQKKPQAKRSVQECEKELEEVSKKFANCKVQLEAKSAAHMQALLKVEHYQKMTYELSTLLKKSDMERNKYTGVYAETIARIDEHKSKLKEMADQLLENDKFRDQILLILSELKATQRDLLNKEAQLAAARHSKLNMETAINTGKEKKEEAIHMSKHFAIRADQKDLHAMLSEKDEKIELATMGTSQSKKRLEHMTKSMMQEFVDMEQKERKIKDQSFYIEALEIELNRLKRELTDAKKKVNDLNINNESLTGELQKAKAEIDTIKEREIKAQAEIAHLNSQLNKSKSLFAGFEDRIKQKEHVVADKSGILSRVTEASQTDQLKPESDNDSDNITIPLKEYKSLIKETEKANEVPASVIEIGGQPELAHLKKELEVATQKIVELRARAEQAVSRAELSEKAKAALEDKIKRRHEERQRRRAALAALKEESTSKPFSPSSSDARSTAYQPLGKVLNMKF
ncbi:hypothetical protein L6164_014540 [Bauhinia variegata]|uniref:Uncharacterized protein n=1 Tax=Bauhinia variegata TaxID=167791 RepID=A0ACB9NIC6_BAUVA|nr:hypothetical protein L6164_014540 [Bauhinia variegata]